MKQLVVCPSFPFSTQTFVMREVAEVMRLGHEVIILSPDEGDIQGQVSAQRLNIRTDRIIYADILHSALFTLDWRRLARRLRHAARREEYGLVIGERRKSYFSWLLRHPLLKGIDLIHAHFAGWAYSVALPLHELLGVPFTFTAHDSHLAQLSSQSAILLQEKASAITFPSRRWRDLWIEKTKCRERLHILPNAVDINEFRPSESPRADSNGPRIITIGRLLPQKRIADSLHAIRSLLDLGLPCNLTVIGSGPEEASLKLLIKQLDIRDQAVLLGAQPHDRVVAELQNSDIYLHPSEKESFGVAVIEAMAVGLPVVAALSGGTRDTVVHGVTGHLYTPGDLDALVSALASLVRDADSRKTWGNAGRARVQLIYSWQNHMTMLCDLWGRVLAGGDIAGGEGRADHNSAGVLVGREGS